MTPEEKAKAYDKALERAKKWYNEEEPDSYTCIVESIFPELQKDEDEEPQENKNKRIRKALISILKSDFEKDTTIFDISVGEIIAWLEKQSEPVEINPSEFDLRLNKLLKQFKTLPKEELESSLSFYLNVIQNDGTYKDEKQGEQNYEFYGIAESRPAKGTLKTLVDEIEKPKFKVGDRITKSSKKSCLVHSSIDDTICEVAEVHDTCYILNTKEGRIQEPFEWQDYYELVEPAWSEEDEELLNSIIKEIESELKKPYFEGYDLICNKKISWLKSLKERMNYEQRRRNNSV